jgi:hypothetical protein
MGRNWKWAAMGTLAVAGVLLGALSAVPALFGREVGAGFAAVAQAACVLDRDGSAQILAAGDSRSKSQIIPALISERSGKRCVNIGEVLDIGGDPATLVNVLYNQPALLASHPIVLLSVSVSGVDDASLETASAATLFNFTPLDHALLWARMSDTYPKLFFSRYLPSLKREALHRWRGDGFACDGQVYLPSALQVSGGFRPAEGRDLGSGSWPGMDGPVRWRIDGSRWRVFRKSLRWIDASPAKAVILYNAPFDPEWVRAARGTSFMSKELRFAAQVEAEASTYAKVRFVDFLSRPVPELTHSDFHDFNHLNEAGAAKFSRIMAESLAVLAH